MNNGFLGSSEDKHSSGRFAGAHPSIVIADGNEWYIERIKPILCDLYPDVEWTMVSTAEELIKHCRDHSNDMLLIDFSIDGMGLIDVVKILRKHLFTGRIAVSSFYDGALYAESAVDAGADTYFDKPMLMEFLLTEFELSNAHSKVN